jgi:hypothetical protein
MAARRRPETSSSRATINAHPAREHPLVEEHDQHGEHEELVRDRIEERPERGVRPLRRARRPSNQSVAIATQKRAVAP